LQISAEKTTRESTAVAIATVPGAEVVKAVKRDVFFHDKK